MSRFIFPHAALCLAAPLMLLSCQDKESSAPAEAQADRMAALHQPSPYSRLILEIDAVPGLTPSNAVQAQIGEALAGLLDKPDGISFVEDEALPAVGADHAWTDEALFALAEAHYNLVAETGAVKIHVMVLDGHSAEDSAEGQVLGLAWSNTHLVLFADVLRAQCMTPGGIAITPLCEEAERAVWLHELGHIVGLVNRGAPPTRDHVDPDHDAHCDNPDCVMYWAYERQGVFELLKQRRAGAPPTTFDEACRADLAAAR
ncbi:hypothetical protein KKB55_10000 [Myxococcota bacterium]|nr:hypothetical protein [Myxococcota bacterium]MBU1898067.1 hypothetical protein [Myxococcota bacterium]